MGLLTMMMMIMLRLELERLSDEAGKREEIIRWYTSRYSVNDLKPTPARLRD